jgi:hypothetical protein
MIVHSKLLNMFYYTYMNFHDIKFEIIFYSIQV